MSNKELYEKWKLLLEVEGTPPVYNEEYAISKLEETHKAISYRGHLRNLVISPFLVPLVRNFLQYNVKIVFDHTWTMETPITIAMLNADIGTNASEVLDVIIQIITEQDFENKTIIIGKIEDNDPGHTVLHIGVVETSLK